MNTTSGASAICREARFAWEGLDACGRRKRGLMIAHDVEAVRAHLEREHIIPTRITHKHWVTPKVLRSTEVTLFSRQLASLLQSGLALLPALEIIASSDARTSLSRVVRMLIRDIVQGLHFSAALARHPKSFDAVYCQLVSIGEASGSLGFLLEKLTHDRERTAAQKAKLRSALSYPIGILFISLAITAALMIWVVPTFEQIFDGFGAVLPAPTRFVLWLSKAVSDWAIPTLGFISIALLLIGLGKRHSKAFCLFLDRLVLACPIIGRLTRILAIARWTHALSLLLKAGMPLANTFDILSSATHNAVFDLATRDISKRVRRGERLSHAMRAVGCFSSTTLQPIAVAEESGALDRMLADLAALDDRQLDERIAALTSIAEPLIMVMLGGLIGGLVIAMYLPIIQLGNVV